MFGYLFNDRSIDEFYEMVHSDIKNYISSKLSDKYIMEENIETLSKRITTENKIKPLRVNFDAKDYHVEMDQVPASDFEPGTFINKPSADCAKVIYHFPIHSENDALLPIRPKGANISRNVYFETEGSKLIISYQTHYGNSTLSDEAIKEVTSAMRTITQEAKNVQNAINTENEAFNKSLYQFIFNLIKKRKDDIQNRNDQNRGLGDF